MNESAQQMPPPGMMNRDPSAVEYVFLPFDLKNKAYGHSGLPLVP
jgi:hypothetical protein